MERSPDPLDERILAQLVILAIMVLVTRVVVVVVDVFVWSCSLPSLRLLRAFCQLFFALGAGSAWLILFHLIHRVKLLTQRLPRTDSRSPASPGAAPAFDIDIHVLV
jgi:hypothetical protein